MEQKNQISKLDNSAVIELTDIASKVEDFVNTENDASMELVQQRLNQNPTILQRLFPGKFRKMQEQLVMNKMKKRDDAQEVLFDLYTGIKLELARQQGDTLIAATGMHLRDQLTKFALDKISSMGVTMESHKNEFVIRMKRQLQNVGEYKDFPELSEPYHQSLKDEITTYFSFNKNLLDGFEQTLHKKVKELK